MSQAISEDPVVVIVTEKHRIRAIEAASDAEADAFLPQQRALDKQLIDAEPVSLAGILAGLEEAKYEFESFHGEHDNGDRIIVSRIDAAIRFLKEGEGHPMTSPANERKAAEIADAFLDAELDDDRQAKEWLVERITTALEEAEKAGYTTAMRKRF